MVQLRLAGCAKAALRHSRGFGSSSQNYAPTSPLSVAKLLANQPADPDNVVVNGFVRSLRNQKKRSFAAIGDGSSLEPLQALLTPDQAESLSTGAAVRLTGRWLPSPAQGQSHELHVAGVDVLGSSDAATFPLQKKYQSPEFLRTIPHIRPRTPFNSAMLRLRSQSIAQLTQFFAEKDFTQTHPPIITSSDCEGAGETFVITTREEKQKKATEGDDGSFFRSPKYLTVSSQLHLEALAQSVGNVWTLSPTFRAEKSDTARHLSEFYMLEAEMTFVESMDDLMVLIEQMLQSLTIGLYPSRVVQEIIHGKRTTETGNLEKDAALAEELEQRWQGMMSGSWPRITYTEAISQLQKSGLEFEHEPVWGSGLQAEHERYIASSVGQGKPVFVTAYPKSIKPFYMLPSNSADSRETVECFDLLVPEVCEIIGGSMREYRSDQLIDSMRAHGMLSGEQQGLSLEESMGSLKWYVDLRKWGTVPHGGFGLGFDRLLGYLSGVPNIREVVTFPRWVGRCEC